MRPEDWVGRLRLTAQNVALLLIVMAMGTWPGVAGAQSNEDCLGCHSDPDLTGARGGAEMSVYVDPAAFSASVHGGFACVDCHQDLQGAELPHAEDLAPVDCAGCHDDVGEELGQGPHAGWAPVAGSPSAACERCHGVHDVLPPSDATSPVSRARVSELCVRSHRLGDGRWGEAPTPTSWTGSPRRHASTATPATT